MPNSDARVPPWELGYWLQRQVLLCALILIIPAVIAILLLIKRGNAPLRSSDLWSTCWKNLHPRWLLLYRASAFLVMSFLLYQVSVTFGPIAFFFYTQWTFLLVTVYFLLATIVSAKGCRVHEKNLNHPNKENGVFLKSDDYYSRDSAFRDGNRTGFVKLDLRLNPNLIGDLGILDNVIVSVYQACAGAVVLTDIVFWGLLLPFMVDETFKLTMLIGFMHSVNAVFLIIESTLNRMPCNWFGLIFFVLWSFSYIIFQWILHACCMTWWPYPFLELSTPLAPLWYIALTLFHLPCYGLYVWLTKSKHKVFPIMFPSAFVRDKVD